MHIVLTVNAAWNIWNFRRSLVLQLMAAGHDITVLAPRDETVSELNALGCRFRPIDLNAKSLNPAEPMKLVRRFKLLFQELSPDIVLSFTIKNNIFGAIAAKKLGIPFIPNITGLGTAFLSGGALQIFSSMLYRKAFRDLPVVFFQNTDDSDFFLRLGLVHMGQIRHLPGSGIDLDRFHYSEYPIHLKTPKFLMIARLLRDKGVFEYIEAARLIKVDCPELQFELLGATDSNNRSAIDREQVRKWVRAGVVDYLGTKDDVRPTIAGVSCVVLPSYREGAPRTLMEAAAMARPVIATDVPGCRAVVDDGRTGFLCKVKDADSLAEAMRNFIALTIEEQSNMGEAGRAKMQQEFDHKIVATAYNDAIQSLSSNSQASECAETLS